jgi:hypothetical protein
MLCTLIALVTEPDWDIIVPIIMAAIMLPFMLALFVAIRKGVKLSKLALPDFLPEEQPPDDPAFGKVGGYYAGSAFANERFLFFGRMPVIGKGYEVKGNGKIWLSPECVMIGRYLTRKPLVIPFGLIHKVDVGFGGFSGKRIPGPIIRITWGREELPLVTGVQVSLKRKVADVWADEISRRAQVWRSKIQEKEA